jgi:hypothetical protein
MQVATVKKSTSFRTKKRGKVPPRFETLFLSVSFVLLWFCFLELRATYVASKVI